METVSYQRKELQLWKGEKRKNGGRKKGRKGGREGKRKKENQN